MDIENIIELYKKYNNYSEVERLTGIDRKKIKKILIENGVKVKNINQHKLNLKDEDIKNIIKMFNEGMSTKYISESYGCNPNTINNILKKEGIDTSRKRERCNLTKYKVDESYFDDIDDEYKAYFLGFILADGCVHGNALMISLQERDKYILSKFLKLLNSNHPLKKIPKYNAYGFRISCSKLVNRLKQIGICERKSYKMDFDKIIGNIPKDLHRHFVRGIFDGDGCIKKYKQTYYDKYFYHFSITGLENVVTWCKYFLNIKNNIIQDKRTKSLVTYYCLTRETNTLRNIYHILYDDANIYLHRKYEIFREI